MRRLFFAVFASMVLAATAYAWAGEKGCAPHEGKTGFGDNIAKIILKLDLTDAQKREIATILKDHRPGAKEKGKALCEAMKQLHDISYTDGANETAVKQAYAAVATAGEAMALKKAMVTSQLKKVLTPEQLKKLDLEREAMIAKVKEKIEGKFEEHRGKLDEWIDKHAQ